MTDKNEAQRFLARLDPHATAFTFQTFDDSEKKSAELARVFNGSLEEHWDHLIDYSERGAGIFVTVNQTDLKGRKAKNVVRVRALFIDLDGSPLEPVLEEAQLPGPHIIVESSPGRWHAYWLVDDLPLEEFSSAQKILIERFGADKAVHDLPRVMRLPGFLHRKAEPAMVKILTMETVRPYPANQMLTGLAEIAPKKKVKAVAPISSIEDNDTKLLNDEALVHLGLWVPKIWPEAIEARGGYRVTSEMLGRELQEDLSLMPEGIKDFGIHDMGDEREGGRTAIEIVQFYLKKDYNTAAAWLRLQIRGIDTIIMREGSLVSIVEKTENALLGAGVPIYVRGGELVTPIKTGSKEEVRRAMNAATLHPIDSVWLQKKMATVVKWARLDAKGGLKNADPARKYAELILASKGEWKFPHLRAVINAPTLSANGSIIEQVGFDAGTGLLLDFKEGVFPPVPTNPTQEDAIEALEKLCHPLRGFPFVDGASKAVAVSAMLSALIRPSLRTVPLHGFDAPMAGTGKSMLAEIPGLLVQGLKPPSISQGKTSEEDEKRLATILHAGDPLILIDNCTHQIHGDFLCSMLSQEVVQARILGASERRILPCTALVMATANNLTFAGDVSRRAVKCSLDARDERPDAREFNFDAQQEVIDKREELVIAGLTILRAFVLAGKPVKVKAMGSFQDWSWVRGALKWLGMDDPADTREKILENDPRKSELLDIINYWEEIFKEEPTTLTKIGHAGGEFHEPMIQLRAMLSEASNGGKWNARSVGWWMRRNANRIVDGRCFTPLREARNGVLWKITRVEKMGVGGVNVGYENGQSAGFF